MYLFLLFFHCQLSKREEETRETAAAAATTAPAKEKGSRFFFLSLSMGRVIYALAQCKLLQS